MSRITYLIYGELEHLFSELSIDDFVKEFWNVYGQNGGTRKTRGIEIVSTGTASDISDKGGYCTFKSA